ncbi:hypothetical protein L0152_05925, partial [bacterium]|nr:hypothetical protein [bacterium]
PRLVIFAILFLLFSFFGTAAEKNPSIKQHAKTPATILSFHDFFEPESKELKPSSKLIALNQKRVQLIGFMAQVEEPLHGSFYLTPQPVFCDESGGGIGDLPVESVLVIVPSYSGKEVPFVRGALVMTGILEIGKHKDENGHPVAIQLILDDQRGLSNPKSKPKKKETNK